MESSPYNNDLNHYLSTELIAQTHLPLVDLHAVAAFERLHELFADRFDVLINIFLAAVIDKTVDHVVIIFKLHFYTRKGLDLPTRELLTLVTLTALNMPKQVAAHLKGNLRVGNSVEKLYWTMLQCMPYVGFPAVANTLNALLDIVTQRQ